MNLARLLAEALLVDRSNKFAIDVDAAGNNGRMALNYAPQRRWPVGEGEGTADKAVRAEADNGDAGKEGGVALDDGVEEVGRADGQGRDRRGVGG